MTPQSTVRSFRRTRCATESLLRKMTIRPAAIAGFGENDVLPRSPTMVIVTGPRPVFDEPEGAVELPPHPTNVTTAEATTSARMGVLNMTLSFGKERGTHEMV